MLKELRRLSHFCYEHRGLARISETARKFSARFPFEVTLPDFDGDLQIRVSLNEHMGSQIFWRGYYSGPQLQFLAHLIEPHHTFVDVGANQGEFTLFAAKRLPRGKVVAFEPSSELFERLSQNVAQNGFGNVVLRQQGLSSKQETAVIYSSVEKFRDGTYNSGLPSLYQSEERSSVLGTVDLTTLDAVVDELELERLDIIKMDIEGAEMAALTGAAQSLKRFKPTIMLEVNKVTCASAGYTMQDLLSFVEPYGYKFFCINRSAAGFSLSPLNKDNLRGFQDVACIIA